MRKIFYKYNQKFKQLKIKNKILVVILSSAFAAQIIVGVLGIVCIAKISLNARSASLSLGKNASSASEKALKNQSESYLKEISASTADASDAVFEEISDNILQISSELQSIYKNHETPQIRLPSLPETTANADRRKRGEASSKFFAVDSSSASSDKSTVLAYDVKFYPQEFQNKIYSTNINSWLNLSDKERRDISNSKIVVSDNAIPQSLVQELKIINSISYSAKSLYESNIAVSNLYIGTESGILYRYGANNSSQRYDPRTRPWYKDAISAIKAGNSLPVWQSTYVSKSENVLCVTCSKAFTDENGHILGVAAIDMYLDDVNEYIIGKTAGNNGYTFVTDSSGKIIMHPDYSLDNDNNFCTDPLSQNETPESYKNLLTTMKSGAAGVETAKIGEKSYYIAYSPLATTGWSLGVAAESGAVLKPASDIMEFINEYTGVTQNSIITSLIITAIGFLVAFAGCGAVVYMLSAKLTKTILNPIQNLSRHARIIGKGDFLHRIPVHSRDELGKLSKEFNSMAENLQKYTQDLAQTIAEKEKIHSELMIAKQIQTSMLPCIFPAFPNRKDFDVYAMMDPAKEVGGDFYDFFFIDKNNFAVVIADVSGKGISAALFMVIAKILIKNELQSGRSPSESLEIVNKRLCENNVAGMFVTAFVGIINLKSGKLTFANAGHNPPLLYKSETDKYEFITSPHGFVLGGVKNKQYPQEETFIHKNDTLFLYTDGVTEAVNADGKFFSKEKLKKILNSPATQTLSLKDIILSLRGKIDKFSKGTERSDDITMLAFKNFETDK